MSEYLFPGIVLTLVGAVAPYIISFFTKMFEESWARYVVAVVLSGIMGFIGVIILKIPITLANLAVVLPAVITLSNTAWKLWWHRIVLSLAARKL